MADKNRKKKDQPCDSVYQLWGWILLTWALYRYFLRLPEAVDEFIAKPLVFVLPVLIYVMRREKKRIHSIGITVKNLFPSLYIGLGFGFLFAIEGIVVNAIKYGQLTIAPIRAFTTYGLLGLIGLSLATAITEEILARGFLFTRIWEKSKKLLPAAFISTLLFVLLHVPILVTSLHLKGPTLALFFLTDFVLGFANSLLMASTGSLVAPILVHLFWNMTVAMYL